MKIDRLLVMPPDGRVCALRRFWHDTCKIWDNLDEKRMRVLKYALIGAAVAYGISYITKKRPDGSSILDDLCERSPEWLQKGKSYVEKTINDVTDAVRQQTSNG